MSELAGALSPAAQAQIAALTRDGYVVHKRWSNGVELRKGPPVGDGKFALCILLLLLMPVVPFVARHSIAGIFGYRHRVFVTLEGSLHFV